MTESITNAIIGYEGKPNAFNSMYVKCTYLQYKFSTMLQFLNMSQLYKSTAYTALIQAVARS